MEDSGNFWVLSGGGEVKWMGTVNGLVDVELVGKIDTYSINATPVSITPTTGFHYKTGVVTSFPAYDGVETSEAIFHFLAYTFFLYLAVATVSRFLSWKNTP